MNQNFRGTTGIRNLKLLAKSKDLRKKNNVDYDITEYMNNYNTIKNKRIIEEIDKYDSDEENENTEITGDIQEANEFKLIDKLTIESIDSQNDNNLFNLIHYADYTIGDRVRLAGITDTEIVVEGEILAKSTAQSRILLSIDLSSIINNGYHYNLQKVAASNNK